MLRKIIFPFGFSILVLVTACKKDPYALPVPKDVMQNDVIKRSLGPNVTGTSIEFAYAMALPSAKGKLVSAEVEASIAGAPGTYLENNSYYTSAGADIPVKIGNPSVTSGTKTTVTFTVDTPAATLRYFYVVPAAAKGQSVSFTFSATATDGEKVSMKMGPYAISKMDMVRNITVKDSGAMFISITDTAVYTAANLGANASKVDLIYLYRVIAGKTFLHALVAPAADPQYLPGVTLPGGVNRNTKISKIFNLQDHQLAPTLQPGIYIDDPDFQQLDMSTAVNYAINLKGEAGIWVETADGKWRAYIFINSINNSTKSAVISLKRYACSRNKVQGTRDKVQGRHKAQGTRHKKKGTRYKGQGTRHKAQATLHSPALAMARLLIKSQQ